MSVYNAFFMRATDRVGNPLRLQGISSQLSYRNKIYYHFLISEELKDFLDTKTPVFYVEFNLNGVGGLKEYMDTNDLNNESFLNDDENDEALDISDQDTEFIKPFLSYIAKPEES